MITGNKTDHALDDLQGKTTARGRGEDDSPVTVPCFRGSLARGRKKTSVQYEKQTMRGKLWRQQRAEISVRLSDSVGEVVAVVH